MSSREAAYRSSPRRGNYVVRHWRGQISLGVSYWVNSVLLGNVAPLVAVNALSSLAADGATSLQVQAALSLGAMALLAVLNIWSTVGVLRSAVNHPERGGRLAWSAAAFVMVGVGLIGVSMQLMRKNSLDGYADLLQIARGRDTIPPLAVRVSVDGRSLLLSGPMGSGSTALVRRALDAASGVQRVTLDSIGGRLFEGRGIAREVQRRNLDTFAQGECSSACTIILLAGRRRLVTSEPHVGFHRPSVAGPSSRDAAGMRDLADAYRRAGVPESFIARVRATPPSTIWYPSVDELMANQVVTGLATDAPRPLREPDGK